MRVDLFDFDLPEDRIALRPASPRESARLLRVVAGEAEFAEATIADLPDVLRPGDVLVFNDSKVLPAALTGTRVRDGAESQVSLNLHRNECGTRWRAFARPAKRIKTGDSLFLGPDGQLHAQVIDTPGQGEIVIDFAIGDGDLLSLLNESGAMPLPPYIASKRAADAQDRTDYQNVYAQEPGSVAAPTAGFHFTEQLMEAMRGRGLALEFVTLHVGAGTFLPVKSDDTDGHAMHAEYGEVSEDLALRFNEARRAGRRLVCVGTTSLRLLESAAASDRSIKPFAGETDIFITPGYTFRAADALITNFHLPKSTLFMLVSAFAGLETMQRAYAQAIEHNFRFYSYGDACLLERREEA